MISKWRAVLSFNYQRGSRFIESTQRQVEFGMSEEKSPMATDIPTYIDLMFPTLKALESLGGEASKPELDPAVIGEAGLTEAQLGIVYEEGIHVGLSKVVHRLAFARSYLKKLDAINTVSTGRWSITSAGEELLSLGDSELRHREHALRVGHLPVEFLDDLKRRVDAEDVHLKVRELLAEWGVSRRGSSVVARIAKDLADSGLRTVPSFASTGLDVSVQVLGLGAPQNAESEIGVASMPDPGNSRAAAATSPQNLITIGTLASATAGVESVAPDDPILRAQSLMESHDYSQLAVMSGKRTIKGVVSWESIAKASMYGRPPLVVSDALAEDVVVVPAGASLLEYVGQISSSGYVFVRDETHVVTGIVSAADLAAEFENLANPFLLVGEIEGWLRIIVDRCFSSDDLLDYLDPDDPDREIEAAQSLTFGEYVRLFQDPEAWEALGLAADRSTFVSHLDEVRQRRNEIMHFSPDPMPAGHIRRVEAMKRWLRQLAASQDVARDQTGR